MPDFQEYHGLRRVRDAKVLCNRLADDPDDTIPGVDNEIQVTPTKKGTYDGRCAEYCGLDHWQMYYSVRVVSDDDHLILITDRGKLIRVPVSNLKVLGRATQGVRIMRIDDDEKISAVERLADPEDQGAIEEAEVPAEASAEEALEEGEEDVEGEADAESEAETEPEPEPEPEPEEDE